MNNRDFDYIWDRLSTPVLPAMDAYYRLKQNGEKELAEELMTAMQEMTDKSRAIRQKLSDKHKGQQ